MTISLNKGDIVIVCLDPTIGSEINKTRPAVIVSNNIGNKFSARVIVAPLTSNVDKIFPFQVLINNDFIIPSKILLDQIRTIDKQRIIKKLGSVSTEKLHEIDKAIKIVFDIK
ncbi:MAG: type II toxin-antitoxin system PemK/MazF family toxin [Candidatus Muiribacteriota bacterium]|jgi:mRNA interferase MazF